MANTPSAPKKPDLPYEAKVWRYALLAAAADIERGITKPPHRRPKETLLHFVERAQGPVNEAMGRWVHANMKMHDAIKKAAP